MTLQEEETLVRDVMRFMIFRSECKPGVPVPRGELTKLFPAQVTAPQGAMFRAVRQPTKLGAGAAKAPCCAWAESAHANPCADQTAVLCKRLVSTSEGQQLWHIT